MDTSLKQEKIDPLGGLLLDPSNELRFKGPFENDFSTVTLSISNPTEKRIAFKIKTTAPKRYCVKPNSGVLDPTKSMKVNVLLQPFTNDQNDKLKHKFMVQYMYLNEEENKMEAQDILNKWKDVPTSRLLDIKLKCLFEPEQQIATSNSGPTIPTNAPSPSSLSQQVVTSDVQQKQQQQQNNNLNNSINDNINNTNNDNNEVRLRSSKLEKINLPSSLSSTTINQHQTTSFESASSSLDEATRIKKLAMPQSKTNQTTTSSSSSSSQSLIMFLNNKSIWIIILLVAIIIYLLLFK